MRTKIAALMGGYAFFSLSCVSVAPRNQDKKEITQDSVEDTENKQDYLRSEEITNDQQGETQDYFIPEHIETFDNDLYDAPVLEKDSYEIEEIVELDGKNINLNDENSDDVPVSDESTEEMGLETFLDEFSDSITKDVDIQQEIEKPLCYTNDFNGSSDVDKLVAQNGKWSWNSEGYLQQVEIGGGFRIAYLDIGDFTDFEAKVNVRMPAKASNDDHTALLFRYVQKSESGYDYTMDNGYAIEIEKGDGNTFYFTLENLYIKRLYTAKVTGKYGVWHEIRVKVIDNTITGYFNGKEIFTIDDFLYSYGKIGFGSHDAESHFDDLEICPL